MFFNDNWISLKDVHDEIYYQLLNSNTDNIADRTFPNEANELVWDFCAEPMEIAVVLPNKKIKKIDKGIVEKPTNSLLYNHATLSFSSRNKHVDLSDGRIGSGSFTEDEETFTSEIALKQAHPARLRSGK